MVECSFETEEARPDGSFIISTCINKADILIVNDPCYGLCFTCAYNKLKVDLANAKDENKRQLQAIAHILVCKEAVFCNECELLLEEALKEKDNGKR